MRYSKVFFKAASAVFAAVVVAASFASCSTTGGEGEPDLTETDFPTESVTDSLTVSETETEPEPEPDIAELTVAGMSLREMICQMFIVTPEQLTGLPTVTDATAAYDSLAAYPVGGLILFGNNILSRDQVSGMISGFQYASSVPLFISVDEEGGAVSRIASNPDMWTKAFPSMLSIGNTGNPEKAYEVGYTIGSEIKYLGFNLDFAPVADVYSNPSNTVIGNRAFSRAASTAAVMVSSAVRGFNDGGVLCTLKHFPGHGDTAEDSHYSSAVSYKTLQQLEACEFLPFRAGINAGAPVVMLSHILTPYVTDGSTPASLSSFMTSYLRNSMGFDGLIITDSLAMSAVANYYTSSEAAVRAVEAGADLILIPQSLSEAVAGIETAVASGRISADRVRESVMRIAQMKVRYGIISG